MNQLTHSSRRTHIQALIVLAVVWTLTILGGARRQEARAATSGRAAITVKPGTKTPVFSDVRAQAKELIGYADSISLTPEQQKLKEQVLSKIPTTCCKQFSMATCCCPCNMAKTIWGLSNVMLVRHGANAVELKAAVESWVATIGKSGFTGDACFKGGCGRPFANNGCGGMDQDHIIF